MSPPKKKYFKARLFVGAGADLFGKVWGQMTPLGFIKKM